MRILAKYNLKINMQIFTISDYHHFYQDDPYRLREMADTWQERLQAEAGRSDWLAIIAPEALAAAVENRLARWQVSQSFTDFPLFGVPFVVKDNIDVEGFPTTAACPALHRQPTNSAFVVQKLENAGAICLGKSNLDQLATGLVGTRSPYGAVKNAFSNQHIAGGSSSGSATLVARGLVPFSLGTDTAGSGRVPAALNNSIGLKPTRGLLSTAGVIPACKSLDCVSIFALTVADAEWVFSLAQGFDEADAFSRQAPDEKNKMIRVLGIPSNPQWHDDAEAEVLFSEAVQQANDLGFTLKKIDFSPLYALAALLYEGSWLAERQWAVEKYLQLPENALEPLLQAILAPAKTMTAMQTFADHYRQQELLKKIKKIFLAVDALLVPSVVTCPTLAEVAAAPLLSNQRLGAYTNFVNLADLSALALPCAFRSNGLPFGITLIAKAFSEAALFTFGKIWQAARNLPLGATGQSYASALLSEASTQNLPKAVNKDSDEKFIERNEKNENSVLLAVVGAHLRGMPLHQELLDLDAEFIEENITSAEYRLYALKTTPPKPGLCRVAEGGVAIALEIYRLSLPNFGRFVAAIPSPLGIGTLFLADGRAVKGFIVEPQALRDAPDISAFGGWRAFCHSQISSGVTDV
jgi:allophanate hydrolase